jgi:ribosomal protein S18 acetylase RimI-like enzyme
VPSRRRASQTAPETVASIRPLRGDPEAETFVDAVLPWVHEAGCPYFDWFFGGSEAALETLDAWMRRPSSEVYVERLTLLEEGDRPIGGFVALSGAELEQCRGEDAMAAIKAAGRDGLPELRARLAGGKELFAPVGHDDFYLSKIGVLRELRGRRYGTQLLERYLADGRLRGFSRFRLDVSADNEPALGFYRGSGFEIVNESASADSGLAYVSLLLED